MLLLDERDIADHGFGVGIGRFRRNDRHGVLGLQLTFGIEIRSDVGDIEADRPRRIGVLVVVAVWNRSEKVKGSDIVAVERIRRRVVGQIEIDPIQRLRLCGSLEIVDDEIEPVVVRQR